MAEEATQDIFLNIWLKSGSFKPDRGQPKTWIMSVAHHRIIDVIRSRRRTTAIRWPPIPRTWSVFRPRTCPSTNRSNGNLSVNGYRKAWPPSRKRSGEVIRMAYFDGYSQSEIAALLNNPWAK